MPLTRRRAILGMGSAVAVGTGVAGVSLSAMAANARLVFAGWQGEDDWTCAPELAKAGPFPIRSSYVVSGDELLTKLRTGGMGTIDLITQNKDYVPLSIRSHFLQPLDFTKLPNAAQLFPVLRNAPWAQASGQMYAVPLAWGDSPIIWDPRKWDSPPERYSDLADKKYRGALACLDDPYAVLWLFSSSLGHPDPARLTQAQLDETVKLAKAVKRNIVLMGSFGDATDVMIRGDASMAFSGWEMMLSIAARKGVTLRAGLTSKDRGFLWADAYSIPRNAPNSDLAYRFINAMLGKQANATLAGRLQSAAVTEEAAALMGNQSPVYNYGLVRKPGPPTPLMNLSVIPPLEQDGNIVGIAAWRRGWQEMKA
jgi:spermidine/putrescine-binding protein